MITITKDQIVSGAESQNQYKISTTQRAKLQLLQYKVCWVIFLILLHPTYGSPLDNRRGVALSVVGVTLLSSTGLEALIVSVDLIAPAFLVIPRLFASKPHSQSN